MVELNCVDAYDLLNLNELSYFQSNG